MRIPVQTALSLFTAYQALAAECAKRDVPFSDELDAVMGRLETMLTNAEVETPEDLLAKVRFLASYKADPAAILPAALETLAAGTERVLAFQQALRIAA